VLLAQDRPTWRIAIPFGLYAIVIAVYWMARDSALAGIPHSPVQLSLHTLLLTWPSLSWFYLKHLLWPVGLSLYYDQPPVLQSTWSRFWVPLLEVCLIFAGITLLANLSHKRLVIFATCLLLLPLAPAFFFPALVPTDYAHDRYLYLPSLGFGILVAVALHAIAVNRPRISLVAGVAIVLGFSIAASAQMIYWANDVLLFNRATRIAPGSLLAFQGLGRSLLARGRTKEGMLAYSQVLRADPTNADALYNLGLSHFLEKDYAESDRLLTRLVESNRPTAEALALFADTLNHEHRYGAAEPLIRNALQLRPNTAMYQRVLAESLAGQGKFSEARQVAEAALELQPDDAETKALVDRLQTQRGR
jgi:tetratricopeptide (TPR) repeat protein